MAAALEVPLGPLVMIEGDEHRVEVMPLGHGRHRRRGFVPGEADEAGDLLVAGLDEGLEDPVGLPDGRDVIEGLDLVDLPDIQPVGAEALQALLEVAHRPIVGPGVRLGGQEDLVPPALENEPETLFAHRRSVGIIVGRVPVIESVVQGAGQDGNAHLWVGDGAEPAAGAESDERDGDARLPERARRQAFGVVGPFLVRTDASAGNRPEGDGRGRARLEEISPLHGSFSFALER